LRKKNVLWLKLQNGKAKTFTNDNSDGDAYRKYSVAAFYPQWNVAIIEVGYYEGGDVLVVSTSTGSSVTPLAWPHFSPSGKEFASVTSCQAYYCTDGVEIWSTAVDPPTRVYHRDPEADRWYWFGGWGNDGQLNLWVSQVVPPDDSSDDKPPRPTSRRLAARSGGIIFQRNRTGGLVDAPRRAIDKKFQHARDARLHARDQIARAIY
jgi:sugar (pentulose or hexulose) kinase